MATCYQCNGQGEVGPNKRCSRCEGTGELPTAAERAHVERQEGIMKIADQIDALIYAEVEKAVAAEREASASVTEDLIARAVADERKEILRIAEGELMEVHEAGEERVVKSIIEQVQSRGTT